MSKPVVLRLGEIQYAQEAWKQAGEELDVITIPDSTTREEFLRQLQDPTSKLAKVKVIARTVESAAQTGRFDKELCDLLPESVIAVCHNGAGYDQIEVAHFDKRKIQVSNVPSLVNEATANTATWLAIGALRNYGYGNRKLLEGQWPIVGGAAGAPFGHDPVGKTVGIMGLGGIGRATMRRLKAFGFKKFIYSNRHKLSPELEDGAEFVTADELLAQSDLISIHIPLGPSTKHFINAEKFDKMKTGVVIVNTARGAVMDEMALVEAIKSGKVASAGLDVFENEPAIPKELMELPQVLMTPHMGTYSVETRKSMEELVVDNAKSAALTGKVLTIVPELKDAEWVKNL